MSELHDLLDALKQEALLVTHPRHKRVLRDAIDEIRLVRQRNQGLEEALRDVVRIADRKTPEFDRAHALLGEAK
jgi:hypothetical protein